MHPNVHAFYLQLIYLTFLVSIFLLKFPICLYMLSMIFIYSFNTVTTVTFKLLSNNVNICVCVLVVQFVAPTLCDLFVSLYLFIILLTLKILNLWMTFLVFYR